MRVPPLTTRHVPLWVTDHRLGNGSQIATLLGVPLILPPAQWDEGTEKVIFESFLNDPVTVCGCQTQHGAMTAVRE